MKTTKETRARGRVLNAPVGDRLWSFRMTSAGVEAKRRNARRTSAVRTPLAQLAAGGGFKVPVGDLDVEVLADPAAGLWVRWPGEARRLVAWPALLNLGRPQPVLFPEVKA